ncbi:DotA/TraY family protein (plasmid) [Ectopseudomonas mendocina]
MNKPRREIATVLLALATVAASTVVFGDTGTITEVQGLDYSQDFGQKAINWIAHGAETPVFGDKSLLSVVSLTLNAIALAMMAFLAVIGGATYVFQTANKGIPGGQVISSFWAPIRVSAATILLIPLSSGYSTLQYGVITVAEKGNAHGTYVMGVGLDYLYDFGAYRAPALADGRGVVFGLIESEVCRQYINSYTGKETITVETTDGKQGDRLVAKTSYKYNEPSTWGNHNNPRNDYCGAVAFSIEHSTHKLKEALWKDEFSAADGGPEKIAAGQATVLKKIRELTVPIAAEILADESALRQMQSQGEGAQSSYEQAVASLQGKINSAANKVNEAIVTYNTDTQQLIATAVNNINDSKNAHKDSAGWREQTKAMGWPALGTIFWQINVNQSEINKLAASFDAAITPPNIDQEWLSDERLSEVSARINGLRKQYAVIDQTKEVTTSQKFGQPDSIPSLSAISDAGAEGDGWVDTVKSKIYSFFAGSIKAAMFKNGPDDLIINLQYFGSAMSTLAEVSWWAKSITINTSIAVLNKAGEIADSVGNVVGKIPGAGWLAKVATTVGSTTANAISLQLKDISGLIDQLILMLIIVGFTLGVVLPTIPLSLWLMGVISWMLFFIECLLISPMWMAAHGTAEKEGWGSEHTRQGYMLMIGLYLNPILRVAGFFAIFVALKPLAWLVSWFFDYVQGVVVSGFVMIFIFLGSVIISSIFAYSALTRVFGLPSELFERGLRWINGGQEVTGDTGNEREVRNNIGVLSSKSESAAQHVARSRAGHGKQPSASPTETPPAKT